MKMKALKKLHRVAVGQEFEAPDGMARAMMVLKLAEVAKPKTPKAPSKKAEPAQEPPLTPAAEGATIQPKQLTADDTTGRRARQANPQPGTYETRDMSGQTDNK